ncbi:LCP family protein [Blautia sp. An46]|uniref:LCP family protein n=1 Tax=Blautia sp. An46 TaxID=1965636 RepID=UPI000B3651CC|nr:LCP family protein [Blautia sp. An46]OUN95011.1 hypothetical protein B5G00_01500 [Blautia sp. An46]
MEEQKIDKKKKSRLKIAAAVVLGTILLIVAGAGLGFLYLRFQGERSLKSQVQIMDANMGNRENTSEDSISEEEQEGFYITYDGKQYQYNSDVINILCLGIDKDIPIEEKRETGSEGLADVVILASIDTKEDTLKFLAVPRETIVPVKLIDTKGNFVRTENEQITLQYAYGQTAEKSCELMIDTVSNLLFQLPIQRYCAINFQALPALNDAIGGVDLVSIETVHWWNGSFYEGQQMHLEGQAALDYVRQRDETIPKSSMGRLERQKQYITCYLEQAKEAVGKDLTLPVKMFQSLTENMCTDVTVADITYLVPELLNMEINLENISMVPGETITGGEHEEYHVDADALKQLVIQMFYKEVPAEQTNDSDTEENTVIEGGPAENAN